MAEDNKVNAFEIVVDDGSRVVPIINQMGEKIGEFKFRPTDIGIVTRFNETVGEFDKILEPLENVNIDVNGNANEEDNGVEEIAAFDEAVKRLYKAVDYIFGGNASEAFFGTMHPFSPVDNNFYCMQVLEKVSAFIGQQYDAELKKVNTNVSKYTAKYAGQKRARKK